MTKTRKVLAGVGAAALGVLALAASSCRSSYPRRDPTGEEFPAVRGESLRGEAIDLPGTFRGKPVVFLVGYLQSTQFDIDRWLLGLSEAGADVAVREVPTLPGLAPRSTRRPRRAQCPPVAPRRCRRTRETRPSRRAR